MNELNLNEGEQILYECYGKLEHKILKMKPSGRPKIPFGRAPIQILMSSGKIFITNNRIIAQGEIKVKGGRFWTGGVLDLVIAPLSGHSKRDKISTQTPRDRWEIPIKNFGKLSKYRKGIVFVVLEGNNSGTVKIKPYETSKVKLEENIHKLFEPLSEFSEVEKTTLFGFNYYRIRALIVLMGVGIVLIYIGTII